MVDSLYSPVARMKQWSAGDWLHKDHSRHRPRCAPTPFAFTSAVCTKAPPSALLDNAHASPFPRPLSWLLPPRSLSRSLSPVSSPASCLPTCRSRHLTTPQLNLLHHTLSFARSLALSPGMKVGVGAERLHGGVLSCDRKTMLTRRLCSPLCPP